MRGPLHTATTSSRRARMRATYTTCCSACSRPRSSSTPMTVRALAVLPSRAALHGNADLHGSNMCSCPSAPVTRAVRPIKRSSSPSADPPAKPKAAGHDSLLVHGPTARSDRPAHALLARAQLGRAGPSRHRRCPLKAMVPS
eukprot:6203612-Pleurochrysis_carterae.AAC.2